MVFSDTEEITTAPYLTALGTYMFLNNIFHNSNVFWNKMLILNTIQENFGSGSRPHLGRIPFLLASGNL